MSGTLFVVATPIGNLEDITLRALRVLREADVIAAEDTRRTAKLLAHYSISTPMLSFHEHNSRARIPQLLTRLAGGAGVALVTDAGTPGISDPGSELITACWDGGVRIDPIPGVSAPVTAAVVSGFPLDPFTIFGFIPSRPNDRKRWFERAKTVADTFTFFETPHRIQRTLAEVAVVFGDRPIMVAREMTKVHQQFTYVQEGSQLIGLMPEFKGEFTVVVGPATEPGAARSLGGEAEIFAEFGRLTEKADVGRRAAVSSLARKYRRTGKEVYSIIERMKQSVE